MIEAISAGIYLEALMQEHGKVNLTPLILINTPVLGQKSIILSLIMEGFLPCTESALQRDKILAFIKEKSGVNNLTPFEEMPLANWLKIIVGEIKSAKSQVD